MAIAKPAPDAIEQLCPQCGLCCDGTLFADVELRAADDARRLKKLGLDVVKKGANTLAFAQPCPAFDGGLCGIYPERPKRCRLFACSLLKRVQTGKLKAAAARQKISQAKAHIQKVSRLLPPGEQGDPALSLTQRFAEAMSAPLDLSIQSQRHQPGKLMREMNGLMERLQRDFLTPPAD